MLFLVIPPKGEIQTFSIWVPVGGYPRENGGGNDNLLPLAEEPQAKACATETLVSSCPFRVNGRQDFARPTNSFPLGVLCALAVKTAKMRGQIGQIGQTGQIGQAETGSGGKQRNWIPVFAGMTTIDRHRQTGQTGQTGQIGQTGRPAIGSRLIIPFMGETAQN